MAGARPKPLLALAGCFAVFATAGAALPSPAAASAEGCAGANLTPKQGNLAQIDAAVVCLVNAERARHGERALVPNASLTASAEGHSADMARRDYFSHVSPGGSTPLDRMRASGYIPDPAAGYAVGENIAWGTLWLATPQAIVTAWMASPDHRANILDTSYRETGVGVAPRAPASLAEGEAGAVYTQDFGRVVVARRSSNGAASGAAGAASRKGRSPGASGSGRSSRRHARHAGQITSAPQTREQRSNRHNGSSRRKVRHRHRIRARHRARHRRTARRTRRAGAHQRSRRRHRQAGR